MPRTTTPRRIGAWTSVAAFLALPATASVPGATEPGTVALATAPARAQAAAEDGPWRLDGAVTTPSWLKLSGHQRTRFEYLRNTFRAGSTGDDDLFSLRTALRADVALAPVEGTLEIMDSRAYGADDATPLNTTIVNALEVLQLYAGWRGRDVFGEGDEAFVLAGRHTMDVGSRRLIARNRFRNTINNFTGVNATLDTSGGAFVRAFFVLPVRRRPTDRDSLEDNDIRNDEETDHVRFWGLFGSTPDLLPDVACEAYYYHLHEDDGGGFGTRNRRIGTVGARVYRDPEPGELDFEVEAAYQFGDSRASASGADTTDLDHRAHFEHASLGYSFRSDWNPRLLVQFDYASGDDDPTDGENNRFDTLFGARRFEFGPTGILGAFARSNIVSPGLRLELTPSKRFDCAVADRFYYLASDTDAWTTAGVRDVTGSSGDYVGNLAEIRGRWHVVPKGFTLEGGFAYLFKGSFAQDAPNANGEGDTSYVYVQTIFTF